MAYTFDQIFAADPSNPGNVAANGVVTIFAPGDASQTPLQIMDTAGNPLANPVTVNANGYGDAFSHATLDRVAWAGGGFSGFFTSYEGLKEEAVAARAAAEEALGGVPARVADEVAAVAATGAFKGDDGLPGRDGSNVLPTDEAIAEAITTPGTPANTALNATVLDFTPASPILSKKLKGGNIAPKPGGYAWKGLFGQWDWANWIKPQVDRASALGLNAVRLIGGPSAIFADPWPGKVSKISQETYDAHWTELAEYCLSKGLYLYPCVIAKWEVLDSLGLGADYQDPRIVESVKTTVANLSRFSNVIGFDIFQEGDARAGLPWVPGAAYSLNSFANNGGNAYQVTVAGTSAASGGPTGTGASITDGTVTWAYQHKALAVSDVLSMMAAVRTVTHLPLTMSRSLGDGFGWTDTTSMWYQVFMAQNGADFIDLHLYTDTLRPGDPDFLLSKSGKPLLVGEYGAEQSLTVAAQGARFSAMAALHNRRGMLGSFVWALADQQAGTNPADQWGVWDNTGYVGPAFPGASSAPLSSTAGKRTQVTNLFPTFVVADRMDTNYQPANLLTPTQARPRTTNTVALGLVAGWTSSGGALLAADPRGLAIQTVAAGTTFAAISMRPEWRVPVVPAAYYRGKVTMLAATVGRTVSLQIDWYDSAGGYLSASTLATGTDSTTIPTTLSLLVKAHASAAYGVLLAKVSDATQPVGEVHLILDAEMLPAN